MAEWKKEEATRELQWLCTRTWGPNPFDVSSDRRLQQKWLVTEGGAGTGVTYSVEWRDVPEVSEPTEDAR